ncbi:MAG: Rpn family recombination-promoting nuclease/putative transposase [Clostridiales Family XIII bacterium]|nr:Rpn family recombination-promoting nuclease/putative transposase [Clostridiales Family XIII bacterium]
MDKNIKPLRVKLDFVFKLIFGDQRNVDILAGFLKAILDIPEDEYERLTIVDPYVKKETEDDKYGVLDVKIHTKSGSVIHVEVQIDPIPEMDERALYYQSKMITEQMKSGNDYKQIKRVVSILITDFEVVEGSDEYFNQFRYRSHRDGREFTRLSEINTLELKKLPKDAKDDDLWYWTKFISSDDVEVLEMIAEHSPIMKKAVGVLMELSADERTRMIAEDREKARRDWASRLNGAEHEGIMKVARNALAMGMDTQTIISLTGLTREDIENLQ